MKDIYGVYLSKVHDVGAQDKGSQDSDDEDTNEETKETLSQ